MVGSITCPIKDFGRFEKMDCQWIEYTVMGSWELFHYKDPFLPLSEFQSWKIRQTDNCVVFIWEYQYQKRQSLYWTYLTHWGRVMHICLSNLTIIGSDNGLLPDWHQAIIWTKAGILLIGPLRTNLSEILNEMHTFSFKKMHWNGCLQNGSHFVSASMC